MLRFAADRAVVRNFAIPFTAEEREVWKFHIICRFQIPSRLPVVNRTKGLFVGIICKRFSFLIACADGRSSDAWKAAKAQQSWISQGFATCEVRFSPKARRIEDPCANGRKEGDNGRGSGAHGCFGPGLAASVVSWRNRPAFGPVGALLTSTDGETESPTKSGTLSGS